MKYDDSFTLTGRLREFRHALKQLRIEYAKVLAPELGEAASVLELLVYLKNVKDTTGPTPVYVALKEKAWERAKKASLEAQ